MKNFGKRNQKTGLILGGIGSLVIVMAILIQSFFVTDPNKFFSVADNSKAATTAQSWQNISPNPCINGLTYPNCVSTDINNPPNNYGFSTIATYPGSSGTVYTGTNYQGIWKTTNGGTSWIKANTGTGGSLLDGGRLWSLAISPFTNSKGNHNIYTTAGYGNGGVLMSDDGGTTWTDLYSGTGLKNTSGGADSTNTTKDIYAIVVDPYSQINGKDHLLASFHYYWNNNADSGVVESKDGGATWIVHQPPTGGGWSAGNSVWFLPNDPANPSNPVPSTTWLVGSQNGGIWRSTNSGSTWAQVNTQVITHGGINSLYRDPNNGNLFLAIWTQILKSTNNGASWTVFGDSNNGLPYTSWESIMGDGTNLYTLPAFPEASLSSPTSWYTINQNNGTTWSAYTASPQLSMGPFQMAFDPTTSTIYSGNGDAGVFKLQTSGSSNTSTPTPTMMPMTTMPPTTTPVGQSSTLIYDDTSGTLINGWCTDSNTDYVSPSCANNLQCSSIGEYIHTTMTGMGGPGNAYTLHSGSKLNGYLGLCNPTGSSLSGVTSLDFYVLADPTHTGSDPNIQFTTSTGLIVTKPLDQYILGGDTKLSLTNWEHINVPMSSLGLTGNITKVSFMGTSSTEPSTVNNMTVLYMDQIQLIKSTSTLTPTPTPTKTLTPTPTFTPTNSPTLTPTTSFSCLCQSNNLCSNSCSFSNGRSNSGLSCNSDSLYSSNPTQTDKDNYCNRMNRTIGDADGNGIVEPLDYIYYVRAVNGGAVPPKVNTDFNGDGATSVSDRTIVVANIPK